MRLLSIITTCLCTLIMASCTSGSAVKKTGSPANPNPSDFSLTTLDAASALGDAGAHYTLETSGTGQAASVRVIAQDARELKAVAFRLEYDPARWRLESAAGLGAFAGKQALNLLACGGACAKLPAGTVEFTTVLIDPEHAAGFTGGGAVAELRFTAGLESSRAASATPGFRDFVRDLTLSSDGGMLSWTYRNTGDYDLNGETASADLVPIALHYLANPGSADWDAARFADGDGNGEVNQADIVPIAQNYRGTITGYEVWGGNDIAGEWSCIGSATLEQNLRTDASRPYFSVNVSGAGYTHFMLWPYDGSDDEGLWSNIAFAGNNPRRVFLKIVER